MKFYRRFMVVIFALAASVMYAGCSDTPAVTPAPVQEMTLMDTLQTAVDGTFALDAMFISVDVTVREGARMAQSTAMAGFINRPGLQVGYVSVDDTVLEIDFDEEPTDEMLERDFLSLKEVADADPDVVKVNDYHYDITVSGADLNKTIPDFAYNSSFGDMEIEVLFDEETDLLKSIGYTVTFRVDDEDYEIEMLMSIRVNEDVTAEYLDTMFFKTPGRLQNVELQVTGPNEITMTWQAPRYGWAGLENVGVSKTLDYTAVSDIYGSDVMYYSGYELVDGDTFSYTFTDLDPARVYPFGVGPVYAHGYMTGVADMRGITTSVNILLGIDPSITPPAPQNFEIMDFGGGFIYMEWDNPAGFGSDTFVMYCTRVENKWGEIIRDFRVTNRGGVKQYGINVYMEEYESDAEYTVSVCVVTEKDGVTCFGTPASATVILPPWGQ